jgi:uncharacterized protein (DUF302 family)
MPPGCWYSPGSTTRKAHARPGWNCAPTELLIFGHPRGGTPLMAECQQAGIDLPFKALAWQDEHGNVRLAWNDAEWLAARHGLGSVSASAVEAINSGARRLALTAAGVDPA